MRRLMMLFLLVLAPELALAQQRTYIPPQIGATPGSPGSFTLTGPLLLSNGTAAAPSLAFASDPTTGIHWPSANQLSFDFAGFAMVGISAGSLQMRSDKVISFSGDANPFGSQDVVLRRDAANTLALRNAGTAGTPVPQTLNVYKYCDGAACATGYERASFGWAGSIATFNVSNAGTGSERYFAFVYNGTGGYAFTRLNFNPVNDTSDIGQNGAFWKTAYLSRSIQGSKSKALVEATPTSPVRISVPQTALANYGGGSVGYTVYATDGTDSQSLVGDVRFAMVNKAGAETCTPGEVGTPVLAESAGGSTLTCTWTCSTAAADTVDLFANCTSSLVQTTFTVESRGNMQKPNTWTPQ